MEESEVTSFEEALVKYQNGEDDFEKWADELDNLGACAFLDNSGLSEEERLRSLEEEQDRLNSSLISLTSHFAQVQFRLKQLVDADPEEKENLLRELEEFAFRGIPDSRDPTADIVTLADISLTEQDHEEKIAQQRLKQRELMNKLKEQLEDLEKYAYETGEAGMPQSMLLERQTVIIEQLKGKLALNFDEFDKMSPEELKLQVDKAIKEIVNPAKMKEQLVNQLKTQITDLERFIEFLQGEAEGKNSKSPCTCNCPVHGKGSGADSDTACCSPARHHTRRHLNKTENSSQRIHNFSLRIMRRVLTLLQVFTITQFGCSNPSFRKNTLKTTTKGNHWGDLRARLEIAITSVLELAAQQEQPCVDSDYTSDSEDAPPVQCNEKMTTAIRKDLAGSIRDLIQHGLMPIGQSKSLVPFGCFAPRSATDTKMMTAWELILKYYELKNGHLFNSSPARKLSQSFNLEIVGGAPITAKQTLLGAIGNIISTHTPLKRSDDSHFKAFVCFALNEKKLVLWLRLILRFKPLVESYYQSWSYVAQTGFEDALKSLDRLNQFEFDLPVDLAVRQLQNIRDAF